MEGEGREQKHQQILKYTHNTTVKNRWWYIFQREFNLMIYVRENGFDVIKYEVSKVQYTSQKLLKKRVLFVHLI